MTCATLSVKHCGASVVVWSCITSKGTGSFAFIDDVNVHKSSRMNSEVFRSI